MPFLIHPYPQNVCVCVHTHTRVFWRGRSRLGKKDVERRGRVFYAGHICNTGARPGWSGRVILTHPSWMLSGWDREAEPAVQGPVREEKVCSTLKCSQFTIPGHSLPFLLLSVVSAIPRLVEGGVISFALTRKSQVSVKLKMQYFPLYLIALPATKEGLQDRSEEYG